MTTLTRMARWSVLLCIVWMLLPNMIASSFATGIYKWVDENGQLHFSDKPVVTEQNAQEVLIEKVTLGPINTFTAPPVVEWAEDDADAEPKQRRSAPIRTNKSVTIFSAPWCGYCTVAKQYMAQRGISYTDYNIEASDYARRKYVEAGGSGSIPLLVVGRHRMTGFDPGQLEAMLRR